MQRERRKSKRTKAKRKGVVDFNKISPLARNAEFLPSDLKIVMVGDACVGKTCLVLRYMEREYQNFISTIGASFVLKTWGIHDIAIWDTAGEEKYAGLTTFYYRNASAAILTFDMFSRMSFENLQQRYIPILNHVATAKLKVIVATKSDLAGTYERQVSREAGLDLARRSNPDLVSDDFVPYFETSAKTGENVDELFEYIFNYFYPPGGDARKSADENNSISLTDPTRGQSRGCCY